MADAATKTKKTRKVRPVYAIMSVTDSNGKIQPALTRENVTIHSVEKDAEAVLEALETGSLPEGSFYKRIALD